MAVCRAAAAALDARKALATASREVRSERRQPPPEPPPDDGEPEEAPSLFDLDDD